MKQTEQTEQFDQSGESFINHAKKVLAYALPLFTQNSWVKQLEKNDVVLQKQVLTICSFPAYRVTCKYNLPKEELVDKIWGVDCVEKAKKNDPKLTSWRCISTGSSWKLISQTNSAVWPVWPRHILFSQVRFDEDDHTYLVGSSEDITTYNDVSGHVTAHLHMSVYDFCDNGDNTTTVDRITLLDPKGSVPVGIVTMYSNNLVDLFASWKTE